MRIKKLKIQTVFEVVITVSSLIAVLSVNVLMFSPPNYSASSFWSHFPAIIDLFIASSLVAAATFVLYIKIPFSNLVQFPSSKGENSSLLKSDKIGGFVNDKNGRIVGMNIKKNATDLELGLWGYKNHDKIISMLENNRDDSWERHFEKERKLINQLNNAIKNLGPEYGEPNIIKFPGQEKKED